MRRHRKLENLSHHIEQEGLHHKNHHKQELIRLFSKKIEHLPTTFIAILQFEHLQYQSQDYIAVCEGDFYGESFVGVLVKNCVYL